MSISMTGIDHTKADIDQRACFSFTEEETEKAYSNLKNVPGIRGCIIISTCNRMEIWANTDDRFEGTLTEELCKLKNVEEEQFSDCFVQKHGEEAVRHLFYLTCGLKSRIIAEDQIITQVKDALFLARKNKSADNVMEALFRDAIAAGKKVKTEVVFHQAGRTSMDRAITELRHNGFNFKKAKAMVIGNGDMGKKAAASLINEGTDVTVTVRQYKRGKVKVPEGANTIDYERRMKLFPECDLVVSATKSPNGTISEKMVLNSDYREGLIMIDLAVPRDIEKEAGRIDGITLYTIDDFTESGTDNEMEEAISQAQIILHDKMQEFYNWYGKTLVAPDVNEIKKRISKDMMLRIRKKVNSMDVEREQKKELKKDIEKAANNTVNKMMFELKNRMKEGQFDDLLKGLYDIYE